MLYSTIYSKLNSVENSHLLKSFNSCEFIWDRAVVYCHAHSFLNRCGGYIALVKLTCNTFPWQGYRAEVMSAACAHGELNSYYAHPSEAKITQHPHTSVNLWVNIKNQQLRIEVHVNLDGSSFLSFSLLPVKPHSSTKVQFFWCISKQRYPLMMPDKIITGMRVKHIMGCHESPESSGDIFLWNSCVFWGDGWGVEISSIFINEKKRYQGWAIV